MPSSSNSNDEEEENGQNILSYKRLGSISEFDEEEYKYQPSSPPVSAVALAIDQHDTADVPFFADNNGDKWVTCMDEHNEPYYCNVRTGETSWTIPDISTSDALGLSSASEEEHLDDTSIHNKYDAQTESIDSPPTSNRQHKLPKTAKQAVEDTVYHLDPQVQLRLEECRRRHYDLEELHDEQIQHDGEYWVEMYDPRQQRSYYYGVYTGEFRWDRPDSSVTKLENDVILRMVLRLQCAFRTQIARKRVYALKFQANPQYPPISLPLPTEIIGNETSQPNENVVWVEVYDPFHKVLYYYCSETKESRWDPPTTFISAHGDREIAAAITIQSLSRSHLARKMVQQRRQMLHRKQQEESAEELKQVRSTRRNTSFTTSSDDERASISRREMVEEEMEQIRYGDRFWGVDCHDREVRRQRIEEQLLVMAELFWQRVNQSSRPRDTLGSNNEETKKKHLEKEQEANELRGMMAQEKMQRQFNDLFWGIQAEEQREFNTQTAMIMEDALSRAVDKYLRVQELHRQWECEAEQQREWKQQRQILQEKRNQKQYFKWFYNQCTTVDELLGYLWPTKQKFVSTSSPKKVNRQQGNQDQTAKMYALDDLVVRERLEHGDLKFGRKSIFTIHHPNGAQLQGRKGKFDVHKLPPNTSKSVFPMSMASKNTMLHLSTEEKAEEELRVKGGTSLHYRNSRSPDPHIPARFNGIPFKPSQMSPTRDILCSEHSKLNQLPSLSMPIELHKPPDHYKRKSISHYHKACGTITAQHKPKKSNNNRIDKNSSRYSSILTRDHQTIDPMTSSFAFISPFMHKEHVAHSQKQHDRRMNNEAENTTALSDDQRLEKQRRDQFTQQFAGEEIEILHQVFNLMDLDNSGTVNKDEMLWALQHDQEIHSLAKKSLLLRLLLKQPSYLEEIFECLSPHDEEVCRNGELPLNVFIVLCEQTYVRLIDQGLLRATTHDEEEPVDPMNSYTQKNGYEEKEEEAKIRTVFALLDVDGNGVLELDELERELYQSKNSQIQSLVASSKALQPLLQQELFMKAFKAFETEDPRGIFEEEFVAFCLEIASIASLNGML